MSRVARALFLSATMLMACEAMTAGGSAPPLGEPITPVPQPQPVDTRRAALGALLFADARISRDETLSCKSCHDVATNGASTTAIDRSFTGMGRFNTPTVFNAALSFRLNWEGNARSLDQLIETILTHPRPMGAAGALAVARFRQDPVMNGRFRQAYGRDADQQDVTDALVTYLHTLTTPDAPFDRWLHGDATALDARQRRGYDLFKQVGCVSCHQGVNVGGNLFQRHGVFHPLASPFPLILRVPSLRNVAVTPPYFHDGSAPTLAGAVRSMGFAQLDRTLTNSEVRDIVAFLGSLTGKYQGKPVRRAGESPWDQP